MHHSPNKVPKLSDLEWEFCASPVGILCFTRGNSVLHSWEFCASPPYLGSGFFRRGTGDLHEALTEEHGQPGISKAGGCQEEDVILMGTS